MSERKTQTYDPVLGGRRSGAHTDMWQGVESQMYLDKLTRPNSQEGCGSGDIQKQAEW